MAQPLDTSVIYEILKDVQARLARLDGMRDEMREGFASLRAHMATAFWSGGWSSSNETWSASGAVSS